MSTPIVPNTDASADFPSNSLHLDPAPYAVETFTDLERGKQLITLHFRREQTSRALADQLEAEVAAEVARVGLVIRLPLQQGRIRKAKGSLFNAYLEVPLLTQTQEDTSLEGLRRRYGNP